MVAAAEHRPTLPEQPEDLESMRARLPAALEPEYDPTSGALPPGVQRPGAQRRHVFDFRDGTRLIVSMDRIEAGGPFLLHVSMFWLSRCPLSRQIQGLPITLVVCKIMLWAGEKIRELFQANFVLELAAMLHGHLHFRGPDKAALLAALAARAQEEKPT